MNHCIVGIPCTSQLDMTVSPDWVDFCEKSTHNVFASWDVQQQQLTVYTNPSVTVENVANLAFAIRSMAAIQIS